MKGTVIQCETRVVDPLEVAIILRDGRVFYVLT